MMNHHNSNPPPGAAEDRTLLETLREVFEHAPVPLFAKDPAGKYIFLNKAYRALFEISEDRDAGAIDDAAIHDDALAESFQFFDASVAPTNKTQTQRFTCKDSDGETQQFERRTAPVSSSDGELQVLVGTVRIVEPVDRQAFELAERVKELRCLYKVSRLLLNARMSSETLRDVAESLPAGWQFPQLACARITVGEQTGSTSNFVETPWMQRRTFEVDGETGTIEVGYTSRPPVDDGKPFLDEEEQLLQSIADRLREAWIRTRAEQRANLHTTLLDTVGEAVIATDVEGRVFYWNRAAEEIYGWTSEEAMGRNILELTPAEEAFDEAHDVMQSLAQGDEFSQEFLVKDKYGRRFIAHVTDAPFYDDSGQLVGYVGVSRDLSEMKQLEAELSQAKKLEALGRLAGGIAHDFNNMLTAIQGNAILLAEDVEDDEQRETVSEIQHAARRAEELTGQLLAFSRRQVQNSRILNLGQVVGDMQKMLERLLDESLELEFNIAEDAGSVRADASQLNQILINLAVNARDAATERDRIEISVYNRSLGIDAKRKRIPDGDYVVLQVSDTGAGMSSETLENIFEPFFTTKSDDHGTGLGLATVFGIVKQSHGFIDVESELGVGTTFRVFLPRIFDDPDVIEDRDAIPDTSETLTGTILVCEDQASVRRITHRTLTRKGLDVVVTSNGREALQLIRENGHTFDLVISDVVMPGMSGWELERQAHEHAKDLQFLFVSGYPDPATKDNAHPPPPERYLEKPFSPAELIERVANLLS